MDEKTEELRDIFIDVTESDTVTEAQEETRGSLTDRGEVDGRLESVITDMRERYEFDTDLSVSELCRVVKGFYDGESDTDIGRDLDVSRSTVFKARMDLHLIRDRDTDAPFDLTELGRRLDDGDSTSALAESFDVSASTVRRYRRVVTAKRRSRQANDRYRDEFDSILADSDLSARMTEDVQQDGLDDATEGMETDVSF